MQGFLTALILVPVAIVLVASGLFVLVFLAVAIAGGVEGVGQWMEHRVGREGPIGHTRPLRHAGNLTHA